MTVVRTAEIDRPPWLAIAILSASALAYEILLTRLFAIVQWHHFAYMIISLALLGYGISGTFLALVQRRVERHFRELFAANAAAFSFTSLVCFAAAQKIPFNPLEIGWDPRQLLYLLAVYLLLAVPFFAVANCFGLALLFFRRQTHRIYAVDLLGAGVGAMGVIGLLSAVSPDRALLLTAFLGLAATVLAIPRLSRSRRGVMLVALVAFATTLVFDPPSWVRPQLSEFKSLSQAQRVLGAHKVAERHGPLGSVTAVDNRRIPFRHAPGLSLSADVALPPQIGLFLDGESLGTITRYEGDPTQLRYLDYLTSAVPYHLHDGARDGLRVLVLGAGGGTDALQALYHGAARIAAVELNPQVIDLVRQDFSEFAGGLYDLPTVRVHRREARGFLDSSEGRYDIVQVALLDAFGASSAGLHSLSESYLYTVEGLQALLDHLAPHGVLALTRWMRQPPRDALRLFATAIDALHERGVENPAQRLALIRGWKTSTLLVRNGPFVESEIEAIRRFTRERSFDVAYYPGIRASEPNRYNVLDQPYLYLGAKSLLGPERAQFTDRYKFAIAPATDDRPFFFHFSKWRTLPELLSLRASGGLAQLDWGYWVLIATFGQALLASLILILLPLWLITRRGNEAPHPAGARWRVLLYFLAIGLAFLFIEIAYIQKFLLFLSHPLYAVAVVLAAFLVFAGLGSAWSSRLAPTDHSRPRGRVSSVAVATAIGTVALTYLLVLPAIFRWLMPLPDSLKILISIGLIAPLAFAMGIPFPHGLSRVSAATPALVPWAWAINGCASVVSAALATLLAMELGFSWVILLAVALYFGAAVALPR